MAPSNRVLVVLHEEHLGGASLSVLRCVEQLERRGWQFTFWMPSPSPIFDELADQGYDVYGAPRGLVGYSWAALRIPPGPWVRLSGVPAYLSQLRKVIRNVDPAVVHANSMYTVPEAMLARASSRPTLIHVHEMVRPNRKGTMAKRLMHSIGHVVVGVSEAGCQALAHGEARARLIPECVPIPEEPAVPSAVDETVKVGTVGVLSRRKGSDTFVAAASRLKDEDINWRLVGDATAPLDREWASDLLAKLPPHIAHQRRVNVSQELRSWDVFVLPSREDPFPIVVLEAMALGIPVVGTRVDGIAEQITPETGILVPPDDPDALAAAIKELAADQGRRRELGRAGRQRVIEKFSVERQSALLDDAYRAAQALAK